MNKFLLVLAVLLMPVFAFADGEATVPIGDFLMQLFNLVKDWKTLGTIGLVSAVLVLVVQATKTQYLGGLFDKLGPVGKRLLVLGISAVLVGLPVFVAGGSFVSGIAAILGSSAGAVFLNELLKAIGFPFFTGNDGLQPLVGKK